MFPPVSLQGFHPFRTSPKKWKLSDRNHWKLCSEISGNLFPKRLATLLRNTQPGLHHVGCVCEDIEREIAEGNSQRLLLHPISLRTRKFGVVWLCRPGVPYLVELMENPEESAKSHGKVVILLPVGTAIPQFASVLCPNLTIEAGNSPAIGVRINGIEISLDPRMG